MLRLAIIIVNYRTGRLVADCLKTLDGEVETGRDLVVIVDNDSGDGSAEAIERVIAERGWSGWTRLVRSPVNGGFSWANNLGTRAAAATRYLYLNSDTLVRPGAIVSLHAALDEHPEVGLVGPRLTYDDGRPQISAFRDRTPTSELIGAAATGPVSRLLDRYQVSPPLRDEPWRPDWVTFACIMIRREVIEAVGPHDTGFFMYFEDIDYCRRARLAGFATLYWPAAQVVHLRGGTSPVNRLVAQRRRRPAYFYRSRSRYFAKHFGRLGPLRANGLWMLGRVISLLREITLTKRPHLCAAEWRDIFIDAWRAGRSVDRFDVPETWTRTPVTWDRPHFVIIGAMKCATTTLHHQLAAQPGIDLADKQDEPSFFSDPVRRERGLPWYEGCFARVSPVALCGDASTGYAKRPHTDGSAERLARTLPHARLIYLMRHPIDRLISHYVHEWSRGVITEPIDEAIERHPDLVEFGRYAWQLEPYVESFGVQRILPVFMERLIAEPQSELERVAAFIDHPGPVRWHDELDRMNPGAERMRRSSLRDVLVEAPGLAWLRRALVPQSVRDRIKGRYRLSERPELAPATLERVQRIFDKDLGRLGDWLGVWSLDCASFSEAVAARPLTWARPAEIEIHVDASRVAGARAS